MGSFLKVMAPAMVWGPVPWAVGNSLHIGFRFLSNSDFSLEFRPLSKLPLPYLYFLLNPVSVCLLGMWPHHTKERNLQFFKLLFYYSCPNFSPFSLLHPGHPQLPQLIPTLLSMSMGIYTRSFTGPFPVFPPLSLSPIPLVALSLLHISMCLVRFCLLVFFVH